MHYFSGLFSPLALFRNVFGLVDLFTSSDGMGAGSGAFSFKNVGGIVLFNNVAISINLLLVSSPCVRLGIFNCEDFIIPSRPVASCLR